MMKHTPESPKSIIISHVYSSANKGDAALTSVLISDLKRRFPGTALRILTLEAVEPNTTFERVPQQPAFMHYALNTFRSPILKLLYVLYLLPATLLWAAWFRLTGRRLYLPRELRAVAETYAMADLVVTVGGGYLRSREGLMNRLNIPLLLHPLVFSYILGKPTVLYSQSVGPLVHDYERPLVAYVLKRMALVMVREDTSLKLLAGMGVAQNVVRTIDSGFLLPSSGKMDICKTYHLPAYKLMIGVTVRSWLTGEAQTAYERAVAGALDDIIEHFCGQVLFIPQVTAAKGDDDRIVSQRVYHYMRHKTSATVISDEPDHHRIKAIYDELDVLLGTRFHSVIFSLTSFVPVLAIEYEHKTSGIMRDLGLEQWVMKIEDVTTAALVKALHCLIEQSDHYRACLHKRLPPYLRQARQTVDILKDNYHATLGDNSGLIESEPHLLSDTALEQESE